MAREQSRLELSVGDGASVVLKATRPSEIFDGMQRATRRGRPGHRDSEGDPGVQRGIPGFRGGPHRGG